MKPKIVMHNSLSLDGSFIGFDVNMGLHYQIAGQIHAEAHLTGSVTARTGIEMFMEKIPQETEKDFRKPKRENLPYFIIVDSKGALHRLLHVYRQTEYCRDVVVLVSKDTPNAYLDYLRARDYDYHVFGEKQVDLKAALPAIAEKYGLKAIMSDSGPTLNSILLKEKLIDEISLLIHPVITGQKTAKFFDLSPATSLQLISSDILQMDYLHMRYSMSK